MTELSLFMENGFLDSNLRRMNKVYRLKYEACIQALRRIPSKHIQFNHTPSGLNIFLRIETHNSESWIVESAAQEGILVTPASQFYHHKRRRRGVEILFEFGSIPVAEIENIIGRLHRAWFNASSRLT